MSIRLPSSECVFENRSAQDRPSTPHPIWIVSELYYPEEASTGYILTQIAQELAASFRVRVICGPGYTYSPGASPPRSEWKERVFIERCRLPRLSKNKLALRVVSAGLLSVSFFFKALVRLRTGDIVLCVTNPVPVLLFIALAIKLRGARLVILVHDLFPENLTATGIMASDSIIVRCLSRLMTFPYLSAKEIVAIGRDMRDRIAQKDPRLSNKLAIITNWADAEAVRPMPRAENTLIRTLGLDDRFIVQFAGNLGRAQGLDCVLRAVEELQKEPIHFLFIGSGAKEGVVRSVGSEQGSGNVSLLGPLPRRDQAEFLNACDVALVTLAPGMLGLGVPSKAYNIMAAGKPIIAAVDRNSEIGLLVKEEAIGWVVPPGDSAALARAIREARINPEELARMGARARALAEGKYSFKATARAYSELMTRVASESR